MSNTYYEVLYYLYSILAAPDRYLFFLSFFAFVIALEIPYNLIIVLSCIKNWLKYTHSAAFPSYYPFITVVITAYKENKQELDVTLQSIAEQIYPGQIEVYMIFDNAIQNRQNVLYAKELIKKYQGIPQREFKIIEKLTRGGHANSMNLGLKLARGKVLVMLDADTSIDNQSILKAARHFYDKNVIAVSGAVRVRNFKTNLLTRLQTLEYMLGIQLGRFALSEINVVNNISSAFGIFQVNFLRKMGGWLNGSAEDLDITMRIHAYSARYPQLKIIHEPYTVAWTVVPDTVRSLLRQRKRWDGDSYYIYIRRHWRKFNSLFLGRLKSIFMIWFSLFFQIIFPFIIVMYFIDLIGYYPLPFIIVISLIIYIYYVCLDSILFALFILVLSERPKDDIRLWKWILILPFYQQLTKINAAFFILNEIFFKAHRSTTMAPWYVIKKTK